MFPQKCISDYITEISCISLRFSAILFDNVIYECIKKFFNKKIEYLKYKKYKYIFMNIFNRYVHLRIYLIIYVYYKKYTLYMFLPHVSLTRKISSCARFQVINVASTCFFPRQT